MAYRTSLAQAARCLKAEKGWIAKGYLSPWSACLLSDGNARIDSSPDRMHGVTHDTLRAFEPEGFSSSINYLLETKGNSCGNERQLAVVNFSAGLQIKHSSPIPQLAPVEPAGLALQD